MKYRVLIVDDDPDMRTFVRLALHPQFETVEACDGLDALHKLDICEPDFAVLDLEMPVMDGLRLCEAIRRHPTFKLMPVLFFSGHGEKDMIRKGYEVGANLFMVKPVDPARLLKNVEFTFEHEGLPVRRKRHTIEELKRLEEEAQARAAAHPTPPARPAVPPRAPTPVQDDVIDESEEINIPPPRPTATGSHHAPEQQSAPHAGAHHPDHDAARPRIMIVDDEDDSLELMELTLHKDFEVTMARDGMDAIEKIVEYQPDMLAIDIMMPRMNGLQLMQVIRRNPTYRRIPIIVVSGRSTERDRQHAIRMGADDFIAKPFSPDDLLEKLQKAASLPGFTISPKKVPLQEIIKKEFLLSKEKQDSSSQKERKARYREIEELMREESRRQKGGGGSNWE